MLSNEGASQVSLDCDSLAFESVLHYVYSGQLLKLAPAVLGNVHLIAFQYEISDLQRLCEVEMKGHVTVQMFLITMCIQANILLRGSLLSKKSVSHIFSHIFQILLKVNDF